MRSKHPLPVRLLALLILGYPVFIPAEETRATPTAIGVAQLDFIDPERPNWPGTASRPVRVTLWYPAADGGEPDEMEKIGERVPVFRNAPVAGQPERHPLVLLSHGSGGNAAKMFWLGRNLVEGRFIVAAVDHNGNDHEELGRRRPTPTDFFAWERARDLSVALDRLLADPTWSARIDPGRIGAAGFSLGGTTALWTAGARIDLEALRRGSPPPPPAIAKAIEELVALSQADPIARASVARASDSYQDPRIRAVFALAPPMGAGFTPDGLADITIPVHIVVGDADVIAPAATNAAHFARHLSDVRFDIVPGERGHYTKPLPQEQQRVELDEIAELAVRFLTDTL